MQIGTRVVAGRRAIRLFVERAHVLGVAGVADIDLSAAGEGKAMPARTGRHDAVEHVDAFGDGLQDIIRRPTPMR